MIEHMHIYEQEALQDSAAPVVSPGIQHYNGPGWDLYQGDAVEGLKLLEENSIGLSVFSPPFLCLYQYSPTERDLGNSKDSATFFAHFHYVADELMRVTMPGRHVAMHVSQVPAMLVRDGWIGLKDFRGEMVRHMDAWGWIYHGEVVIDKDPQAQAIRIRAKGLAFQQLHKDASWMRPALADYILLFRKPGDNPVPIVPDVDNDTWIQWARPIWYGIKETDTLNAAEARDHADDRHICPLQLGVIERCIRLWSNPNETILDCFSGIGSTGFVALQHDRRYVGCELKPSYAATPVSAPDVCR
jgi:DNA modification methylase